MSRVYCLHPWDEKKAIQFKPWVEADAQRYVLFLEDDPAKMVLQTPHPRIRSVFVSDKESEIFEQIAWQFLYLPFSFESLENRWLRRLAEVQSQIQLRALDFSDQGLTLLKNIKYHLENPLTLVKDLEGAFSGLPALVCGGGPSLSQAISHLNRLQDSAVLLGCGAGVDALLHHKLRPHFAAHVDPAALHTFKPSDISLLHQLRSSATSCGCYSGRHLLVPGAGNLPLESWSQDKLGLPLSFDGGWTVGTFGVAMAHFLGCDPIILVGIDLAAEKGEIYAPGIKMTSFTQFHSVKNRLGEDLVSRPDWVLSAKWLEQFAQDHPTHHFGTVAERGLDIPSMPLISLDQLKTSSGVSERVRTALQSLPVCQGVWEEISLSFIRCGKLCRELLQEMEKIYPQSPQESGRCALLEHDLGEEVVYQKVLSSVWTHWQHPIRLHNRDGEPGLFLNKILLFQSLCEQINAL